MKLAGTRTDVLVCIGRYRDAKRSVKKMVEQSFRVKLEELAQVRIVCAKCGASVEIPADVLAVRAKGIECMGCNQVMVNQSPRGGDLEQLTSFADALGIILKMSDKFNLEFLIPINRADEAQEKAPRKTRG